MQITIEPAGRCRGTISVPGDKSISHRAAIFSSLANGQVEIEGFLNAEDPRATLECMKMLGVEVNETGDQEQGKEQKVKQTLRIRGRGLKGLEEAPDILDAGNSGTTARLLVGLLSAQPFYTVLTGDASLRKRPMGRISEPLRQMGAQIDGRKEGTLLPLTIRGQDLSSINFNSPVASAQVKSALLLAALQAGGTTTITEPGLSRDHTERMLLHFGVPLKWGPRGEIILEGPVSKLAADHVKVPGDISSAAFFMVAAALAPRGDLLIRDVGLNPTRTGILDVLNQMDAQIRVINQREHNREPVGDLHVKGGKSLRGVEVPGEIIPRLIDEIPILAVAAAFAEGETRIKGAGELRVKESDRLQALSRELKKMGVPVEEFPDGLSIQGSKTISGGRVFSHGDHRIAMSLAIAGLFAEQETVIDGVDSVPVSFPGFFDRLKEIDG